MSVTSRVSGEEPQIKLADLLGADQAGYGGISWHTPDGVNMLRIFNSGTFKGIQFWNDRFGINGALDRRIHNLRIDLEASGLTEIDVVQAEIDVQAAKDDLIKNYLNRHGIYWVDIKLPNESDISQINDAALFKLKPSRCAFL